jgi:hypothetical protein
LLCISSRLQAISLLELRSKFRTMFFENLRAFFCSPSDSGLFPPGPTVLPLFLIVLLLEVRAQWRARLLLKFSANQPFPSQSSSATPSVLVSAGEPPGLLLAKLSYR